MTITSENQNGTVKMALAGRLDTTTAPQLEKAISALEDGVSLTLDMEKLEYISSAGLRVLLGAHKRFGDNGLKLLNVCDEVMEVFEMTGFVDILTIA